jgi:hypothetical protein
MRFVETASGDLRLTLLCAGMLFLAPLAAVLFLREPADAQPEFPPKQPSSHYHLRRSQDGIRC